LILAVAFDMGQVDAQNLDLAGVLFTPCLAELPNFLPGGLDVMVDRRFADGV
jgi:hypothetical protein